jgi:hypothetical protein
VDAALLLRTERLDLRLGQIEVGERHRRARSLDEAFH